MHYEDIKLAEEGFDEFVKRTGISPIQRKHSLPSIVIPIVAAVSVFVVMLIYSKQFAENEWIQVSTSFAQTKTVCLPDGTSVKLSPCSQIAYPEKFVGNRARRVMLVGEAFLDVAKDEKKTFIVSAGNMDIIVHGTQFNISTYLSDEEDEVALVEGSVEMRLHGEQTSIFLKPGELVKYDKINNITERRTFAANYYKEVIASNGLQFNNERLADIVATLNRRFNSNIIVENDKAGTQRYYASFINGESVDQILSALNINGSFKISQKGNIIIIN